MRVNPLLCRRFGLVLGDLETTGGALENTETNSFLLRVKTGVESVGKGGTKRPVTVRDALSDQSLAAISVSVDFAGPVRGRKGNSVLIESEFERRQLADFTALDGICIGGLEELSTELIVELVGLVAGHGDVG
jgi:hypothetical protein